MPGSRPLPVRSLAARSTRTCTNLSATASSIMTRLVAVQRCPVEANAPKTVDSTASGRSASARITSGFFPPISHWHFFIRRAPCAYSSLPTSFEPVKETARTSGCCRSSSPTWLPEPTTMFSTPVGTPACSKIRITLAPVNGVSVAGLKTTVFPATKAGAIFQAGIEAGKFHGAIAAITPSGCFSVYAKFFGSSLGRVSPPMRRPSPAMNSRMLVDFWTSPSASFSVLPSSRVIKRASSSFCCSISSAALAMARLRTGAGVSRQAEYAARAAATASRVSSRVESGAKPTISSRFAGLRRSDTRAAEDSTQRPLMKLPQVCDAETAVAMARSILRARAVRGGSVFRGARSGEFAVRFRSPLSIQMPRVAHLLYVIQVQLGDKQLVVVAAGLRHDFAPRIAEIALPVKFADFPRLFRAHAINRRNEIRVGHRVRRLLQLPEIFGEPCHRSGRIEDNLSAVEPEDARAFGKVSVVTDVHTNTRVARLEDRIPGIAGREIKFFPKAGMTVRNVVLAIFAEIAAVGVDHRGGIVVHAGHFHFVDGHDEHHLVFLRQLLHARDRGAVGDALGQLVPAGLLFGAKVGAIEKFLEAEDLHFLLGSVGDQPFVLGDHFLFDVIELHLFRRPFTAHLKQAAAHIERHRHLQKSVAKSLLRGGEAHKDQPGRKIGGFRISKAPRSHPFARRAYRNKPPS